MPKIKNLDNTTIIQNKEQQAKELQNLLESGDSKELAAKMVEQYENNAEHIRKLMDETIAEAKRADEEQWDESVLASRGVRTLTTEEKEFYNKAIEVESFDEVAKLMPPTVFERVFEDLSKEHPLLSRVNVQTTGASTQWVVRKEGATTAFWGDVCDDIKEMVGNGFETIEEGMFKLSGFLVVCKGMFELGPEWLDRYIRTLLAEIMADSLEEAIIIGTGKKMPIGMTKDLKKPIIGGEYQDKEVVELTDFTPMTIGKKILAPTTKGGKRKYTGVTLIVNPLDYASRFFPLGTKQKDDGSWTHDNFAVPGVEFIQVSSMPLGKMISGKPKDYFLGIATGMKLEYTDVLRMVEDQRLYLTRQLVNGRPLDNDSFTVFDISKLGEVELDVNEIDTP